ncbi:MAG: riboflavin synthase [Euryarchaeota archaeon]|nr:riboflavin synthase [Euryarchaeota archaeon]DAC19496.1 MAG TPA: riboflavin synthase subunit alpha [Candidatus Poseidoniales archaeon]DAC51003.1 MAG TPA: riboflavin synthase subunit alpha [Candidatus Poseidoniales archaeon]HII32201.1 riboflavin synthase subunit alpha [Candidatus Poseidoniaceae archaeon]HII56335.1 riboflavin synthase subunit alpha [Candidatus Poseidoniaceae archaeon]|tara:strand:- start:564 stop:1163 length:600 start_codon:yes stop_codon:yes gene_type:complete
MFTGIVQGKGEIVSIESGNEITTFQIRVPSTEGLQIGASVSIDGVCLTATAFTDDIVSFDVIPETLDKTTLGQLEEGHNVNVERSLRYGDEVGGHLLSGHIIGRGLVSKAERVGDGAQYSIIAPPDVRKYIASKGYVGIDGISLTIGDVSEDHFDLHLIPETLRLTTIGEKQIGDAVNLEIDSTTMMIVETVERMMREN